jgi:hypothetical protein
MKLTTIKHEFVKFIPDVLSEGVLYVSDAYGTAMHKCFCGCGNRVVTPLSSTGWQLTIEIDSVSLSPSIGSYQLPCRSHYFITKNQVLWV